MTLTLLLNCFQIIFLTDSNVSYGVSLPFTYYLLKIKLSIYILGHKNTKMRQKIHATQGLGCVGKIHNKTTE